jgi:thiamine-phosphate pyrophosphorylase
VVLGREAIIGFSTHNQEQVRRIAESPVDYIAIGPIFVTVSKQNPDPVVGLEGLRVARATTCKPLVAIGGIHRKNAAEVLAAGADSNAVISDLLPTTKESTSLRVEAFLNCERDRR